MGPGATALARIPLGESWTERDLVKETMAPLVAASTRKKIEKVRPEGVY